MQILTTELQLKPVSRNMLEVYEYAMVLRKLTSMMQCATDSPPNLELLLFIQRLWLHDFERLPSSLMWFQKFERGILEGFAYDQLNLDKDPCNLTLKPLFDNIGIDTYVKSGGTALPELICRIADRLETTLCQ